MDYFFGSGTGTCEGPAGADGVGLSSITEEARFVELNVRIREVTIKRMATIVVNLVRNPIAPELPKIV
jgi:hypothetical protein